MGRKKINNRLGEYNYNRQNSLMKIIKYNKANDIIVEFQDEYKYQVHTKYSHFIIGNVRNPYIKNVYGVGYVGNTKTKENKCLKESYDVWRSMIQRCYDTEHYQKMQPTYKDATVCDEWLCFENFEKWFEENYYTLPNEKIALDKDIIKKGNKVYCPEYCCFVPQRINCLFTKCNTMRGDLPIGVQRKGNNFIVQFNMDKKTYTSHAFKNIEDAFLHYKVMKEEYIKEIAEQYKPSIPNKLYLALMEYKVEITD